MFIKDSQRFDELYDDIWVRVVAPVHTLTLHLFQQQRCDSMREKMFLWVLVSSINYIEDLTWMLMFYLIY